MVGLYRIPVPQLIRHPCSLISYHIQFQKGISSNMFCLLRGLLRCPDMCDIQCPVLPGRCSGGSCWAAVAAAVRALPRWLEHHFKRGTAAPLLHFNEALNPLNHWKIPASAQSVKICCPVFPKFQAGLKYTV